MEFLKIHLDIHQNIKYGNRTKFVRRDIVGDNYNDNRVMQVLLFHVEKFWAEANECKFTAGRNESQVTIYNIWRNPE